MMQIYRITSILGYRIKILFSKHIIMFLAKCRIFVVNYDSSHGKFFEFDLVSAGEVALKRGK